MYLGDDMEWNGTSRFRPISSWLFSTMPHGPIPSDTTLPLLWDRSSNKASPTCRVTPVLVPPVNIQAPVVRAALSNPLRSTFLSFGCSSKLALPPCTVMSSFGSSRFHSRVKSCRRSSGRVSLATLTYCKKRNNSKRKGSNAYFLYLCLGGVRSPLKLDGTVSVSWRRLRMLSREPHLTWSDLAIETRRQQCMWCARPSTATSETKNKMLHLLL